MSSEIPDFSKPFVFFRKANEQSIHHWTGGQVLEKTVPEIMDAENDYWITAPFNFYEDKKLLAFAAEQKRIFEENKITGISIPASSSSLNIARNITDTLRSNFEKWVTSAVIEMSAKKFNKTALSKIRNVPLNPNFDWIDWFNNACESFPNAFIFFVHLPGFHTWAGASPELFLSLHNHVLKSVSLAGTLHPESTMDWTEKESEEQKFVTEYIQDVFVDAGFKDVTVTKPETISIGKLRHLKASFEATYNSSHSLSNLIDQLHPTPAVGGLPKMEGVRFLLDNETHDRNWYSGFVGCKTADSDLDLYVNLRSMEVWKDQALLYAGAGITAASDPSKEWIETENKLAMNLELFK